MEITFRLWSFVSYDRIIYGIVDDLFSFQEISYIMNKIKNKKYLCWMAFCFQLKEITV